MTNPSLDGTSPSDHVSRESHSPDGISSKGPWPEVCASNVTLPLWGEKLERMECRNALRTLGRIETLLNSQTDPSQAKEYLNQIVTRVVRNEIAAAFGMLTQPKNPLEKLLTHEVSLLKAQLAALSKNPLSNSPLSTALEAQGAILTPLPGHSLKGAEIAPALFRAQVLGALGAVKYESYINSRSKDLSDTKITGHFRDALSTFGTLAFPEISEALEHLVTMTNRLCADVHIPGDPARKRALTSLRSELLPLIAASVTRLENDPNTSPTDRFRVSLISALCHDATPEDQYTPQGSSTLKFRQGLADLYRATLSSVTVDPKDAQSRPSCTYSEIKMVAELCGNRGLSEQAHDLYQRLTHLPECDKMQHRELLLGAFTAMMRSSIFLSGPYSSGYERPYVVRDRALRNFYGDEGACTEIQIAYAKCLCIEPVHEASGVTAAEEISRQAIVMEEIAAKTHLPDDLKREARRLAGALRSESIAEANS